MKLSQLREDIYSSTGGKEAADYVLHNCGPWLSRYGVIAIPYRASKTVNKREAFTVKDVRQDRMPMSMSVAMQEILVQIIKDRASDSGVSNPSEVANRHNSAFCYVNRVAGADGGGVSSPSPP